MHQVKKTFYLWKHNVALRNLHEEHKFPAAFTVDGWCEPHTRREIWELRVVWGQIWNETA